MTKRKLIAIIISAAVVLAGTGIGTYAWFTSKASSAKQTFKSGKLVIDVNGTLGSTDPAEFTIPFSNTGNIKPGDTLTESTDGTGELSTITIKNTGSLPVITLGKFTMTGKDGQEVDLSNAILVTDYSTTYKASEGSPRALKTLVAGGNIDSKVPTGTTFTSDSKPTLRDLLDMQDPIGKVDKYNIDSLMPGEEMTISFKLVMDPDADNTYQDNEAYLNYSIVATQPVGNALEKLGLTDLAVGEEYTADAITAAYSHVE